MGDNWCNHGGTHCDTCGKLITDETELWSASYTTVMCECCGIAQDCYLTCMECKED